LQIDNVKMISEQLEFQISQYADGTLPAAEAAALEQVLATDAEARKLLKEYRALVTVIARELPVPQMNFDRLANHISAVVAQKEVAANDANRSYRIAWPTWGRVAIAAMVLIAVGLGVFTHLRPAGEGTTHVVINPPGGGASGGATEPVIIVGGPSAQASSGDVVEIVTIQPSPLARSRYHAVDDVVYRPPRVVIASGQTTGQDSGRLPF
jgi:anti-sigma-K factor RskA